MEPHKIINPNAQFGKKLLNDFYLDPSYININHGSYGSCPKKVIQTKRKFEQRMDFNTQQWFRFDAEVEIEKVRQTVGNYVNAPKDNIFLVENASDGFNGFVKSIKWNEGDVIALPNTSYGMVLMTVQYLVDKYKVKVLTIELNEDDFKSSEALLLKIEDTINSYPGKIRLAINDHISSVPAAIFPIQAIIEFYHEKGIPIFIDGAHAVCQTDIDLKKFKPDGYISNFHKWAYAPKNAAFIYIADSFKTLVHPTITGNFYGQGLPRQYFWTGTRDFSSYCSVPEGLNYYESFGPGAVRQYNHSLAIQAGKLICSIWKTKPLTDDERMIGYLNNIEVPSTDIEKCVNIAKTMLKYFNCYPVIYGFKGKVYCRISAQIYNDISDYQFAAEKFLDLLINS